MRWPVAAIDPLALPSYRSPRCLRVSAVKPIQIGRSAPQDGRRLGRGVETRAIVPRRYAQLLMKLPFPYKSVNRFVKNRQKSTKIDTGEGVQGVSAATDVLARRGSRKGAKAQRGCRNRACRGRANVASRRCVVHQTARFQGPCRCVQLGIETCQRAAGPQGKLKRGGISGGLPRSYRRSIDHPADAPCATPSWP
jgi:hypothetical protein